MSVLIVRSIFLLRVMYYFLMCYSVYLGLFRAAVSEFFLSFNVSNMNVLVKEVKELTRDTEISLNLCSEMLVCVDSVSK